ncbi:phosphate:acyl-[acyl carrier protein] acyltransferase [Caldicellulosiruptor bescii]|uniref:Phosphate acyltransferase n=2 Tax=Caldicellulosiruptor bescii TaxID=31899 RepID=PLSX_CALBD|nr:phosphate acyltransferase PlsX [Caldicellulosiruptor bescii]B9MRF0.1 RecName: Full=Phosphate acyltransferase; AltName: Full=Acyl-ACP phosphotransacylase; AltName: Full=Acyl-[acyl-carrier-protein]--phosphate acyltransferase; AltName: Full=Phosphate-acyl-ACP acyltransferase [Caldicellulosiruptor bescii DSM 6725]ACM60254.1 fatty acid/phospholipid synthesis protein PlsX [Caldicellulosiruptor bescii DSM 6725]PBC87669.1 phosphate:acyl-[acyl carrier protein] acyltransferase [Caldicellulosiruptor bes
MRIGIDAMGGDNAPHAVIEGVALYLKENRDDEIVIFGDKNIIEEECVQKVQPLDKLEIIDCKEKIEFEDEPVKAIRQKKDSSIVVGLQYLKEGKIDAFVSAGSTGALMAGGLLIVGRIKGIDRPALTTRLPYKDGQYLLIDVGSNTDCRPINILQFAQMATVYVSKVLGKKNPTVGLLNIGTEENKGNDLSKQSYELLKSAKNINFVGNVEARSLPFSPPDIVVCDGFVGNIVLKLTEGMGLLFFDILKDIAKSSFRAQIGGLLLKPYLKRLKGKYDYKEVGGAPLLGIDGIIVKCHGSSDGQAIFSGIHQAKAFYENNVLALLKEEITAESEV